MNVLGGHSNKIHVRSCGVATSLHARLVHKRGGRPPDPFIVNFVSGFGIAVRHRYWAIQAGLLTPLTFARHHLSLLAAFTSGAYFLRNGSEFANFPLPTLKAFLEARSQNVSGNKQ